MKTVVASRTVRSADASVGLIGGVVRGIAVTAAALWARGGPAAVTFGAVAEESHLAKSLISHHFAKRELLVEQAAEVLVEDMERTLDRLAGQLASAPAELTSPVEVVALVIDVLTRSSPGIGAAVLELISLALAAPFYRDLFLRVAAKIGGMLPAMASGSDQTFLLAFVLGELLAHCPRHAGAVGLLGLQRRISWFVETAPGGEQAWLTRLLSVIHRPAEAALGAERPSPPLEPKSAGRGAAAKRAAIVGATLDMLAEGDAAGVTHRRIAERAGLPLAATTYHFASKQEILEAAYQQIIAVALAEAQRISDDGAGKGEPALERIIAGMLDFYASRGRRNAIAQFHLALFACRTENLAGFASRAHDAEVELLRARARASGVMMTRNLAEAVTSVVGGVLLLRMLGEDDPS